MAVMQSLMLLRVVLC